MPRTLLLSTAVLLCALTACSDHPTSTEPVSAATPIATAAAQRPTEVDQTFTVGEGELCAFPIHFALSGKAKTIELPAERTIFTSPGVSATLTNLDNDNQETFGITGAFHETILANGDVETVVTGRNLLFDPFAGLVLAIGRFSFVFDAEGNLIQPLQGTGRLIDLCALLT